MRERRGARSCRPGRPPPNAGGQVLGVGLRLGAHAAHAPALQRRVRCVLAPRVRWPSARADACTSTASLSPRSSVFETPRWGRGCVRFGATSLFSRRRVRRRWPIRQMTTPHVPPREVCGSTLLRPCPLCARGLQMGDAVLRCARAPAREHARAEVCAHHPSALTHDTHLHARTGKKLSGHEKPKASASSSEEDEDSSVLLLNYHPSLCLN